MNKLIISAIAIIGLTSTAAYAEPPSFNKIEIGYGATDYEDSEFLDSDGFTLRGSYEILDQLYFTASYASESQTNEPNIFDKTDYSFGAGYFIPIGTSNTFYLQAEYSDIEVEALGQSVSDNGYIATAGIRSMLNKDLEIFSQLSQTNYEEDINTLTAGLRYNVAENIGVFTEVSYSDNEFMEYMIGASFKY